VKSKRALVPEQPTLLGARARSEAPLADRMRPQSLDQMVGQERLFAPGRVLGDAVRSDRLPSIILWGPPGSGKTTLAQVIARRTQSEFVPFSAVLGGVQELRTILAAARERLDFKGKRTILFVDEIHRFNKAQQDAFLPHVESGAITLIGATTENPSFSVNSAVLSRCRVFRLESLATDDLVTLLERALADRERGLGGRNITAERDALGVIAESAGGDARRALGLLEAAVALVEDGGTLDRESVARSAEERTLLYDKSGEEHYNVVSALIKSMRGSDPDAAIYWLMRMLEAGDDPLFVSRRLIIFASEDVGNADPRALQVAMAADAAYRRLGMPEGLFPLAHACLYLASCPKSNAVKKAISAARASIAERGALPVPMKLRNAVTKLMKNEGYGAEYRYPHDYEGNVLAGERYLPDDLGDATFYEPSNQGLEADIARRLAAIRRK
jgi:putative ATPase